MVCPSFWNRLPFNLWLQLLGPSLSQFHQRFKTSLFDQDLVLSICLFAHLCIKPSFYLFFYLPIYLSVYSYIQHISDIIQTSTMIPHSLLKSIVKCNRCNWVVTWGQRATNLGGVFFRGMYLQMATTSFSKHLRSIAVNMHVLPITLCTHTHTHTQ